TMTRLAQLNLYPIKGCRGIALTAAEFTSTGLEFDEVGDREWVVSDADGEFLSQRELPKMALIETRIEHGLLILKAPGMLRLDVPLASEGDVVKVRVWNDTLDAVTQGELTDAWFSAFLGQPCRLLRFDPEQRRLSNSKFTGPVESPYKFADAFAVLITSRASLDDLNQRLAAKGQAAVGMERFRANLVLEGVGAFEEDFIDELTIGTTRLKVVKPCVRCTVPSVDPATGVQGVEPGDTLAVYRNMEKAGGVSFGVNAIVTSAGALRVGDAVDVQLAL
ncbi:MAG: MOSC domain-containing protein, partial [Burkholderiaceae bacterium]